METYKELRERQQKEINALPIGFAFSDKQFEEMKERLGVKDKSELYRLGHTGGFYRKIDSKLIFDTFERHEQERKNRIFTPDGIDQKYLEEMFYYEMCNHEFSINYNGTEDVLMACNLHEKDLEIPEIRVAWDIAKRRYYTYA